MDSSAPCGGGCCYAVWLRMSHLSRAHMPARTRLAALARWTQTLASTAYSQTLRDATVAAPTVPGAQMSNAGLSTELAGKGCSVLVKLTMIRDCVCL